MNIYTGMLILAFLMLLAFLERRKRIKRKLVFEEAFKDFPITIEELVTKVIPNKIEIFDKTKMNSDAQSIIDGYLELFKQAYIDDKKCRIYEATKLKIYDYHRYNYPEHFNKMLETLNITKDDIETGFGEEVF